jgi:phospholipid transport system substrate-binding protein
MKPVIVALALLVTAVPCLVQAEAPDLVGRVGAYDDAVIAIMKSKGSLSSRADKFEPVVRAFYDMPATAAIVVGPKWATTSIDDRNAAIAALTRHSAVTLARGFGAFEGQKFSVDPQIIPRANSKIVKVTVRSSSSTDVIFYQLREGAAGWKIVDVISGGISQLAAQRADVASAVAAGGAAGLAQRLGKLDAGAK